MITEAFFIQHCDNEGCNLGTFEYKCPKCDKYVVDYEIWWEWDNIHFGKIHNFKCECCQEDLKVYWVKDQYEYHVENINE